MASNVDVKINLTQLILIIIGILILFGSGFKLYKNKVENINNKLADEVKIKEALLDSVNIYRTKKGEWVAEKRTLQIEVSDINKILKDTVINLTNLQRKLLENIKSLKDKNDLISAALISLEIKLDSIVHDGITIVDTTNNTVVFTDTYIDSTKRFDYGLTILNVIPFPKQVMPKLRFDSLYFPNEQFVEFHWEKDKRLGYPITFSVTNSNGLFKTTNIDSYIIPSIVKDELNPNFWQKINGFVEKNRSVLLGVGAGTLIGGTMFWYLTK